MADYRPAVERALRSILCGPKGTYGNGIEIWYSPRTDRDFTLDATVPTRKMANAILREAGHAPIFPEG